jgi:hypothetical protein
MSCRSIRLPLVADLPTNRGSWRLSGGYEISRGFSGCYNIKTKQSQARDEMRGRDDDLGKIKARPRSASPRKSQQLLDHDRNAARAHGRIAFGIDQLIPKTSPCPVLE